MQAYNWLQRKITLSFKFVLKWVCKNPEDYSFRIFYVA